jgi:MFS transporter, ACS family, tartrate transporter
MFLTGASAASGIARVNSLGILAGGITTPMVGYLRDTTGTYESGLYFLAVLALAGAVIAVFWVKETDAKLAPGVVTAGE